MAERFEFFGGIDFSGAREPLSNLWSAIGREVGDRLQIIDVRPHAFREDLGDFVRSGWMEVVEGGRDGAPGEILWGADFPFGLPEAITARIGSFDSWGRLAAWVADRPADEIREIAGEMASTARTTDTLGALAPLDIRLYKQTVEGIRWLAEMCEESEICIHPQQREPRRAVAMIEVHPSGAARELGLPRRRTPSRPGEVRARAAALRTFLDFADPRSEALATTLEDAWDATIACLTAYLCRDDLEQPFRIHPTATEQILREGWIYRPPASLS